MQKDRLPGLRKKLHMDEKPGNNFVAPNYNNDKRFCPIYNKYNSFKRKIQAVAKKLAEIQDLVEKQPSLTSNTEVFKSKQLVTKHLGFVNIMIDEINKDINEWKSVVSKFDSKHDKTTDQIVESTFYQATLNDICDCLSNYIEAKNFIDSRMKNDVKRFLKIANTTIDEDRLDYLIANPQLLEENIYALKTSKGINDEITKLEMASVEILNGMQSIHQMVVFLELILQQQSQTIRNIERSIYNTRVELEAGSKALIKAKKY